MFQTPPGPAVVQAASIALAVMKMTKKPWSQTRLDMPFGIELTDEQRQLLADHDSVLLHVAPVQVEDVESTTSVYACPECGRWAYISAGSPPKTCNLDMWCEGVPVKASVAAKVDAGTDEGDDEPPAQSSSFTVDTDF